MKEEDFHNQLAFALYLYYDAKSYYAQRCLMMGEDYTIEQARQDYDISYNFIVNECGIDLGEYNPP